MRSSLSGGQVPRERDDIPGGIKAHAKEVMAPMRSCDMCVGMNMRLLLCEIPY